MGDEGWVPVHNGALILINDAAAALSYDAWVHSARIVRNKGQDARSINTDRNIDPTPIRTNNRSLG